MKTEHQSSITWLNLSGDVTITWDKNNEAAVLELVEAKMKAGFHFFIIKPRFFGLLGSKKVKANTLGEIQAAGKVVAADDAFICARPKLYDTEVESAVESGSVTLVTATSTEKELVRLSTSATEIVSNQTVAMRPIVGG